MSEYKFNEYYKYDKLTKLLKEYAEKYPQFFKLSSICTTAKGREVWVCEITDFSHKTPEQKPAYYVDANHHAGEVTGSMAAIHLIVTLLDKSHKQKYADLLKDTVFYIIPRISPDGAEAYLSSPNKLRSVDRPYPLEKPQDGLHIADVDGDGVIRMMRVKSPLGYWKEHKDDARVMVKRSPSDFGGEYYNVYPEGIIENFDGINVNPALHKWGLDFNRNYPFGWFPENRQPGAGDYPLSNPENKAIADFVLSHKNICSAVSYHTTGGVYIYPPGTMPEKNADKRDMQMYREIGAMATEETGFKCLNIFDAFLTDTVNYSSGAFDDWMYMTQGIPTYTAELWNLQERAGVENIYPRTKPMTDEERANSYYLCCKWIDKNVKNAEYEPIKAWTKFDHPQLGEVEIGGLDFKYNWQNCPADYLHEEVKKNTAFCLRMAMTVPKLSIDSLTAQKVAEGVYKLSASVTNYGYMPTFICNEAKKLKVDQPVKLALEFAGEMIEGKALTDIGHLEGFSGINSNYMYDGINTPKHDPLTKVATWIVKAEAGSEVTLNVSQQKSGAFSKSITL